MMDYAWRELNAGLSTQLGVGSRLCCSGRLFRCNMRQKKFQYFLVGQASLVREKKVACVIDQNQFCIWNQARDQFAIGTWNECVRLSVDDQRGSCDLSYASVAFPGLNCLKLCGVAFR